MRRLFGALLLAAAGAAPASAFVRVYPVFGADLLLGQHFFEGRPSSTGGNLDLRVIPAVKFTEDFVLLPSLIVSYQGTKDVTELAGGAQLFQDSLKTSLTLRPVWRWGKAKFKPYVGYRADMLRETEDESLGKGLFDYRKTSLGAEVELIVTPQKWVSFGVDLYQLRFPNYSSLESETTAGLGRQGAGEKTLDSDNRSVSATWNTDTPFPRTRMSLTASYLTRDYPEQHVVDAAGQLGSGLRADSLVTFGGGLVWSKTWGRLGASIALDGARVSAESNQNNYDARVAQFLPNFYGYTETNVRPSVELTLKGKGSFSLSYLAAERTYADRPAQEADGTYRSTAIVFQSQTVSVGLAVPLGRGFRVLAQTHLTRSESNQRYEKIFAYNYNISSHLVGVSFEY